MRTTGIEPGPVGGTEFPSVRCKGDDAESAGVHAGTGPLLTPEDTADAVHWVATRPARVTVDLLQVTPAVVRSFGPLREHRPA